VKKANPFYKTKAWQLARDAAMARDGFLCQHCKQAGILTGATTVHHRRPLTTHPELALELDNLESLCAGCHNKLHTEKGQGGAGEKEVRHSGVRIIICHANPEIPPSF